MSWLPAFAAFGTTALLVHPVREFALARGLTDRPAAHKPHKIPTPYLGGLPLALVATTALPALLPLSRQLSALLAASVLIGLIGLRDDLKPLTPLTRLIAEAMIAAIPVAAGLHFALTGLIWLDAPLTVVWLVVLTNSANLLDNSDGALAGVAFAASVGLALAGLALGLPGLAPLMLVLAGSAAGFLAHNRAPALIFMGDCGSLFLGFLLAGSVVHVSHHLPATQGLWPVLLLGVAVADTATVVVTRVRAGRSIFQGGTDHLAHRLRRRGLSPLWTSVVLALLTGVCGLAALLGAHLTVAPAALRQTALVALGLVAALSLVSLPLRRPSTQDSAPPRPRRPVDLPELTPITPECVLPEPIPITPEGVLPEPSPITPKCVLPEAARSGRSAP